MNHLAFTKFLLCLFVLIEGVPGIKFFGIFSLFMLHMTAIVIIFVRRKHLKTIL